MSGSLIILLLIVTWPICFMFTYKIFYKFLFGKDGKMDKQDRGSCLFMACTSIFGVIMSIVVLIAHFGSQFSESKGFNEFLSKLEK
jgi:hypothetical protein